MPPKAVICHVVCAAKNNVIGNNQGMPWHIKEDLKHFKKITYGSPIIMGRKTWQSLPGALPGRESIIVTRQNKASYDIKAHICTTVQDACSLAQKLTTTPEIFIIGGGELYRSTLSLVERIYLTRLHADYPGEITYPELKETTFKEVFKEDFIAEDQISKKEIKGSFLVYQKQGLDTSYKINFN